jgi:hypothetical protein
MKFTTLGQLEEGQYAVTTENMAVLAVSSLSFTPVGDHVNVVHIANGVGSFPPHMQCVICSQEEAFNTAKEWRA